MLIDSDVLVIGSGIAGLSFALRASKLGSVNIVTKKSDTESNTNYAQGGIAAVMDPADSFEAHKLDTMVAGAYLCKEEAVDILVKEGPDRVRELMEWGVEFTQNNDSPNPLHLDLGREGGHNTRRIVHAADLTGKEIERALIQSVKNNPNINVYEHDHAVDLIIDSNNGESKCNGAYVLDSETGNVISFRSKITMLATGGCCQVYLHSTNPEIATGDGVAMACRAGALIANMEFIQFHPTTLYHPDARSFLISEAVRGEGGVLRLKTGETFMERYHEMGCLAPRDIVARAIDNELKLSCEECVFLDITHIDAEKVKAHFPNIYEKCLTVGIDITKDWIPIVPAAHYSCGGVVTDINGRTSIDNLYACGETSCTGVHGANRLASNSLLEAVVFSRRAANDAELLIQSLSLSDVPEYHQTPHSKQVPHDPIWEFEHKLKAVMWNHVGIIRNNERLSRAMAMLREIRLQAEQYFLEGVITPKLLELRNMALTALLITASARARKESRGLHFNTDYPNLDDVNFKRDTELTLESLDSCIFM